MEKEIEQNNNTFNTNQIEDDEMVIDLGELFHVLVEKWMIILVGFLVGLIASGIYTWVICDPVYYSSSLVSIRGGNSSISSLQDLQIGAALTKDYEVVFKSRPVMEQVINELHLEMKPNELARMLDIENLDSTRILKIGVQTTDPNQSAQIVNSVVKHAVSRVNEIDAKEPYVVERAVANPEKVGPSAKKNLLLGSMLGFFLTAGTIAAIYIISDRVHNSDEVERILGIPVIGFVPESSMMNTNKQKKSNSTTKKQNINSAKNQQPVRRHGGIKHD